MFTVNEGSIIAASESSLKSIKSIERKRKIRLLRNIYALVIFVFVAISIATLAWKQDTVDRHKAIFTVVELSVLIILTIDYVLRWITAPARFKNKTKALIFFPFTFISILLLASLIPSIYILGPYLPDGGTKNFIVKMQSFKFLRIIRIVMLANLFPPLAIFKRVIAKNKWILYNVFFIVVITIVVFGLVMYNVEGQNRKDGAFGTFRESLYFSTITLTTIGYGDISPVTDLGRAIVMVMSIIGIGILAIPSGVIAGGFLSEAEAMKNEKAKMEDKRKKSKLSKLKVVEKKKRN